MLFSSNSRMVHRNGSAALSGRCCSRCDSPPASASVRRCASARRSRVDLSAPGMIEREFEDQAIGIGHVDRAAIAVLQDVGVRRLDARRGDALLDGGLRLRVDRAARCDETAMAGILGPNSSWSSGSSNWKKASAPPSPMRIEGVAVSAHLAEQLVRLAPGRDQRQPMTSS